MKEKKYMSRAGGMRGWTQQWFQIELFEAKTCICVSRFKIRSGKNFILGLHRNFETEFKKHNFDIENISGHVIAIC